MKDFEMNSLHDLKNFVLAQSEIIDKPGKLLYSSGYTLRNHPIYFIGTKPGGNLKTTIRDSLNDLDSNLNEYLDYSWDGRPPGQQKLQKQVKRLFDGLGFDLREVPATNIVFTRHKSITTHPDLDGDALHCWPIHLRMLSMVKPQTIVAYGSGEKSSPFSYLRKFLQPLNVDTLAAGQGNFSLHRFTASVLGQQTKVVVVPHLTRYSPYKYPCIMAWIKDYIYN